MKLQEIKEALKEMDGVHFELPNGTSVPQHFHLTEMGLITKKYVDCGGTYREEEVISFQLWSADDFDHRLSAEKFLTIIEMGEKTLNVSDLPIEFEYQGETIGKYDVKVENNKFVFVSKKTNCLAMDKCGIPTEKPKVQMADLANSNSCTPGGGCC